MDKVNKDTVIKLSQKQKRVLQYRTLRGWSEGKLTGIDCIEKILEYEKLIFINESILEAARDEEKQNT